MHITEICSECESRNVREMTEVEKNNPDYYTHVRSIRIEECDICKSLPGEDDLDDLDYDDD